jgi:DNA ligase-1
MKPMLACDWDERYVRFPVWVQPKIDGVRAVNLHGALTGRSMKTFGNRYVTNTFTDPAYQGFDGEMAAEAETIWWLFDYITPLTMVMPYSERYASLRARLHYLQEHRMHNPGASRLRLVPFAVARDMAELKAMDAANIQVGYEGTILRDPLGMYKFGRCTAREATLMRIKAFVEEDAVVNSISEGETNLNEANLNALGYIERSTHKVNMIGNFMVGTLHCTDVKTGQKIDVAPGCMTHDERRVYFKDQARLIGKTIKYKTFKHGVKDKPRFPTFQSIRDEADKEA